MNTAFPRYPTLLLDIPAPHVLSVTLNRPESLNAISTQVGRDLLDLWTRLTVEPHQIRCVVLTGAGDRAFCAGGDSRKTFATAQAFSASRFPSRMRVRTSIQ